MGNPRAKSSVFIATSLDGFIARTDGSIDWLEEANKLVPPGEDCGFKAFMDSVDTLVMGKNTFAQVMDFEPWPYGKTPMVVLSRNPVSIPEKLRTTVSCSSESPNDLVNRLSGQGARHLYVDGGITIQRFMAAGLIDELTITLIPVLLGVGKPLFGPLPKDLILTHVSTKAYDFGFVQMKYRTASE